MEAGPVLSRHSHTSAVAMASASARQQGKDMQMNQLYTQEIGHVMLTTDITYG